MFQKNNSRDNTTVAVAMSGGVDSSVVAALLLEKGFRVIGLTMRLWVDVKTQQIPESNFCDMEAVNDSLKVAETLGIPHYTLNLKDVFKEQVVDYFVEEYLAGRTPNPCVVCNREIKFGVLLRSALEKGAHYLATGHYVRSAWDANYRRYFLKKGLDSQKDQSYTLYSLNQFQLSCSCFPLGELSKDTVRSKAKNMGLDLTNKPESQEVCFIPDNNYRDFLWRQKGDFISGPIKDTSGKKLGNHQGLPFYTVGQRRGLGLTGKEPFYVIRIDPKENALIVGPKDELYSRKLLAHCLNFMKLPILTEALSVKVRIRYRAPDVPALLHPLDHNGVAKIEFLEPQAAVTPGQSVVFYQGDDLLGGGIIKFSL